MASKGQIKLNRVLRMLKKCAPGHRLVEGKHKYIVRWKDATFPDLPKGAHGSKKEVQRGVVKRMVRWLGIDEECAEDKLPQLS